MPIDAMSRAARGAYLADVHGALAERRHVFQLKAGVAGRNPSETLRMDDHRLLIAWRRILDGAAVDVLPNCLVAVLADDAAIGGGAREDSAVEIPEVAHFFVARVQLLIAHEAIARRPAHLQQQHDRRARVGLWPIECSLGKIAEDR